MLTIQLPKEEFFDNNSQEFRMIEGQELQLEHSLISLSKWESLHEKPFLDQSEKTDEEVKSYVRCMIFSPEEFPENITDFFTAENYNAVNDYIDKKMTATWFSDKPGPPSRETITSELIYYWMIAFSIPIQCETWHLNRLLTLIKVCNVKNQPQKKMSRSEIMARNRELNAKRKAQYGTSG